MRKENFSSLARQGHFLSKAKKRYTIVVVLLACVGIVIIGRTVHLAILGQGKDFEGRYRKQKAPAMVMRSDIVDRNGIVVALNIPSVSVYVNPQNVLDAEETISTLHKVFPTLSMQELRAKIYSNRYFVWIAKAITPEQKQALEGYGMPGVKFFDEFKRFYPYGRFFAHLVGITDGDSKGIVGLERGLEDTLKNNTTPVVITADLRVQIVVHDTLKKAMEKYKSTSAFAMVVQVKNGEVLAMVSVPDFDPNARSTMTENTLFNRALQGVYEQGSSFKIFTIASALDVGIINLIDTYNITSPLKLDRFDVYDFSPYNGLMSVPDLMITSSNVGMALMARQLGTHRLQKYYESLGFFAPVAIEIKERGQPLYPTRWREINTMTMAYGYGIAVSQAHVAHALLSIANGGVSRPLTFVKPQGESYSVQEHRVFKGQTVRHTLGLMRLVVALGTGRLGDVKGYAVGGKTATAIRQVGGDYAHDRVLTSFAAVFPVYNPAYIVVVSIEEPKGYNIRALTGGAVAGPLAKELIEKIIPILGIKPMDDEAVYKIKTLEEKINFIESMPEINVQ